eukprot:359978-Chlamydomonas_euryale.AAC.3
MHSTPCTPQVGACIVDSNRVILGIGYNGFPRGCADGQLPWSKKASEGGNALATKCGCHRRRRTHFGGGVNAED